MKGNGSKAKGRAMALIFGISIIVLYTLPIAIMIAMTYFLGGESVTADIFNWLATHWFPNTLFVVLGFIEIALGFKFLSVVDQTYHLGILDREIYLAIWIVTFSLLGLYLLGKLKFSHDSDEPYIKVKKLFMAIGVFAFVVYMIPGMWGAPLKALSGYMPPIQTLDFNTPKLIQDAGGSGGGSASHSAASDMPEIKYGDILKHPQGLHGFFDLAQATEYAKKVNKPLLVDFTGHGCVNCREMEANVLSSPDVKKLINENYVFVSLYVDDKLELPESEWIVNAKGKTLKSIGKINADYQMTKYLSNAQPYYVTTDVEGNTIGGNPVAYDKSVENYIAFLKRGIEAFNNKK